MEEKENINLGLLKLIQKSKAKKLNYFENWKLNRTLSSYLKEVIPVTPYENLESLGIDELKERLSGIYYEAMQIPNDLIRKTLDKMKRVETIQGRYYIKKKLEKNYQEESDSF